MAVFQGLPGVEVTVLINGVRVREYQDDDIDAKSDELSQYQASKTISKYIESLTGEEFSIEVSPFASSSMVREFINSCSLRFSASRIVDGN